ncbi:MAG: rRNA maturation RNase YbeY [Candidatus Sungbacteria bacterium RIFCSPLOWO2_01_FULL_47_10]|uniref:Endoribonuclease YbeY n=1 Tax=Candidatus Sungbacteria bacterium RIFCSPLOWO2_01_FULL_47_10 TaxID=1802276 RepID=A0A1G2L6G6_9BACT|nr:MAG: rRNA maturation RNase YbeY [Candidatus Sungbacteria bacterium RIFCSPLOWO2_01_FULL_47_10]
MKRNSVVKRIKKILPKTLLRKLPKEITVKEITPKQALRLNLAYRKKRKPANVLSFRYGPHYGEILVCPEVIRHDAKMQGNSYKYQMTWMILHGMLHLGGLHHEKSHGAELKSGKIEREVLTRAIF